MPEDALWPAPTAAAAVHGAVTVPGSKSVANRALVLAALADGGSTIAGVPLAARDIALMIRALQALGCRITLVEPDGPRPLVQVQPGSRTGGAVVDCGLAGTVMRFVPPLAALGDGPVRFDGDPRARERPMAAMLAALRTLGVEVDDAGRGALPFTVVGRGRVPGGGVTIDASGSSQFVSALLLAGARFDAGVTVRHRGAEFPSLPHIDMTCRMLRDHGIEVTAATADRRDASWAVVPGAIRALDRTVEPDLSNALPLAAAAVVTGGEVLIREWPRDSLQPAAAVLDLLNSLGAQTRFTDEGVRVRGTGRIRGITADMRDVGELVPTVAAVCALADSPSTLTGIGHIAGHETDRLSALADQINARGGDVTRTSGGLLIRPCPLTGGVWHTYHDHRMATAGAIIGLVTPGILVADIATTAKTFAEFPQVWAGLLDPATGVR